MVICKDCRHIDVDASYSPPRCKMVTRKIDVVTGNRNYAPCSEINRDGECKMFEPSLLFDLKQLGKKIIDYFDLSKSVWKEKK